MRLFRALTQDRLAISDRRRTALSPVTRICSAWARSGRPRSFHRPRIWNSSSMAADPGVKDAARESSTRTRRAFEPEGIIANSESISGCGLNCFERRTGRKIHSAADAAANNRCCKEIQLSPQLSRAFASRAQGNDGWSDRSRDERGLFHQSHDGRGTNSPPGRLLIFHGEPSLSGRIAGEIFQAACRALCGWLYFGELDHKREAPGSGSFDLNRH